MCLDISNSQIKHKRLRKGSIRYKVMLQVPACNGRMFYSLYFTKRWQLGVRHRCGSSMSVAELRLFNWHDEGLHVFTTLKDAIFVAKIARQCAAHPESVVVVQLRMEEHIASGAWYCGGRNLPSETWRYGTILKVCA